MQAGNFFWYNYHTYTLKELTSQMGIEDRDILTQEKLETLRELEKMFSDPKNRFVISTFVDYFQAYLLKNGNLI
jgi:hypothetical protein